MKIWEFLSRATHRHPLYEMQQPSLTCGPTPPRDIWAAPPARSGRVDPNDPGTAPNYKPDWAEPL